MHEAYQESSSSSPWCASYARIAKSLNPFLLCFFFLALLLVHPAPFLLRNLFPLRFFFFLTLLLVHPAPFPLRFFFLMLLLVHPALTKLLLSEIFLPWHTPYPFRISSCKLFLCMLYFFLFCSIQLYYYFLQMTRWPVPPIKILFFHSGDQDRGFGFPFCNFTIGMSSSVCLSWLFGFQAHIFTWFCLEQILGSCFLKG